MKESRTETKKQPWPAYQIAEAFAAQSRELAQLRRLQTKIEISVFKVEAEILDAEKRLASITADLADAIQVQAISALPSRNEVSS